MKYLDLIERNRILGSQLKGQKYEVHILSNVIVNEISNVLEYNLRINDINAHCIITNYDNIIQNAETSKKADCVIIFWELSNIIEDILFIQNSISDKNLKKIEHSILNEIDYVFNSLKDTKLVIFNKFSLNQFNNTFYFETKIEKMCLRLNNYIISKKLKNFNLIDLNKIFNLRGLENYINDRDFNSIKTLYKLDFFKDYSNLITPLILNKNGRLKKVIIFDCDNTLWPGILGEDGINKINTKLESTNGNFFYSIQKIILDLYNQGIILCICSKNNEKDILDFIDGNLNLLIKSKHFLIKKINWRDKHNNIIEISRELNLPLDSFLFIDDSKFEINLIKDKIPEVKTLLVPTNIYEYPRKLLELIPFFYRDELTNEDIMRNKTYEEEIDRVSTRKIFSNIQDYLKSLNINIKLYFDETKIIKRMSQITQKTNQFNLTTQRYSELEIKNFLENSDFSLIAISVSDKFGDSGVTGLSIIQYVDEKTAIIDSLILSCRVLGRKIEYVFLDLIINYLKEKKIELVKSSYVTTLKNDQVLDYYDNNKFTLIKSSDNKKEYNLQINEYIPNNIQYIKVNN